MATEACRDWRGDLGMEAIGALDESQRTALLAHLDGCGDCRTALAELSTAADALDLADMSRIGEGEPPNPPNELAERILERLHWERTETRRRRWRAAAASVVGVAAAVLVAVMVFVGASRGGAHGTVVALRSTDRGVHAQAVLYNDASGTRVRLKVGGLKDDGDWYWLWVTGADGKRIPAGTFAASRASEDVTMTAALPLARTQRVWVTDAHDRVVLDGYLHSA
jgi:anti-sigma-K factor RskA